MKTVFLFGSSGLIGSIVCKYLLKEGYKVIGVDIKQNKFKKENFHFEKFDLTKTNKIEFFINKLCKVYSIPENTIIASYPKTKNFQKLNIDKFTIKDLEKNILNHLGSYAIISSLIGRKMKKNKIKGSILMLSSIYGHIAQSNILYRNTNIDYNIAYPLIKGGIVSHVKQLASILGEYDIRVNCISPGGINSTKEKNFENKNFVLNFMKINPIKRFCVPEDVANLIVFLVNEKSSYITGQNFIIDGGYTII